MFLLDGQFVYSPTDVTRAACPYQLLAVADEKLGWAGVLEQHDPMMERAARLGDAHEARVLEEYRARFGPFDAAGGHGVAEIDGGGVAFRDGLVPAREATFAALGAGADVVFQGTFFDGRFYGRSDFLLKEVSPGGGPADSRYAVVDTKLTNRVRGHALLQLAAYADQLIAAGVAVAERVLIHHGNGVRTDHLLSDLLEVYRAERRLVEGLLDAHLAVGRPASWEEWRDHRSIPSELAAWGEASPELGRRACGRCGHCAREAERTRDVKLLPGIRGTQRERLFSAGVHTLRDLAERADPVPGVSPALLERMRRQARLQDASLDRMAAVLEAGYSVGPGMRPTAADGTPLRPEVAARFAPLVSHEVVDTAVLRALPVPSGGDIYFDFEGDPLWSTTGAIEGGLEYLFGLVEEPAPGSGKALDDRDGGSDDRETYRAFWAHSRQQEKQALLDFLGYVRQRRARHPDMRIYHYAAYEKTALERLAERHGVGGEEVLGLIRDGVLVDLYPVVKNAVAVSQPSYSIKKLEPLYMGSELRDAEGVTGGADSVVAYADATAARVQGDEAEFERAIAAIADYNRYDCVSTRRLLLWLRGLAGPSASVGPTATAVPAESGEPDGVGIDHPEAVATSPTQHLVRLLRDAATRVSVPPDAQALTLLASAVDYHRREDAPAWQAYFERLAQPLDWWAEDRDVFVVEHAEVVLDWTTGARGGQSRSLRLTGRFGPGSTPEADRGMLAVYPLATAEGLTVPAGCAHATNRVTITSITTGTPTDAREIVEITERGPGDFAGSASVPIALVPEGPIPTRSQHAAIVTLAAGATGIDPALVLGASREGGDDAAEVPSMPDAVEPVLAAHPGIDLLRRLPPRLAGLPALPQVQGGDYVDAITTATKALDRSTLAVQGPPGTGKTYVAARVIARLVTECGWRVGVVAQSHAVVENLLSEIVAAGLDPRLVGKAPKIWPGEGPTNGPHAPWTMIRKDAYARFLATNAGTGCVLGGTAWDMTSRSRVAEGGLDLLVVDEAGQLSLATTLAVSAASSRLLLLGDPQQLPQVTQGTHDEPVDASALAWAAGFAETMPASHGYFIEQSWRMHPALCRAVSSLAYTGRLVSAPITAERRLDGLEPGVYESILRHQGNATSSPDEAARVLEVVRSLLGRHWVASPAEASGNAARGRPLEPRDMLVVAPYNAQVACVREVLDAAGLPEVRVGTVDKFQGQEAVVAMVTLAASSPRDAPRGLGFLLDRHRLNVAVSRGQWAAVIIRSSGLTDALPTSGDALADLGAFLELSARAQPWPLS